MILMIKAIETEYRGHRFRSRLEADWAATLDDRQISWVYEPEGYVLSDGTHYLPDFYLPSARAWLEVKGDHQERLNKVEQFAADLWEESGATSTYDTEAPMVLLGQSPVPPMIHEGVQHSWPWPRLLGMMGPGKAYSVIMTTCRECGTGTVIALWQSTCRNCRFDYGNDASEVWMHQTDLYQEMVKAPRWSP